MSDMIADLLKQDIRLKAHHVGPHKTTCPRCSHTRKNQKDPCLWVNVKESNLAMWKCNHCLWTGAAGDVSRGSAADSKPRAYIKPVATQVSTMPQHVLDYIQERGIGAYVLDRNKVYFDVAKSSIAFPYYIDGKLTNIKYRSLDKRFSLVGGAQLTFYGLDDIKGADEIIIVEGEFDKLALDQCGLQNVISVPNGAPARAKEGDEIDNTGAFAYLAHAEPYFKAATKVYIAVDDDAPGENLRYELARRIGAAKCFVVKFPHKDANGCLKELGVDAVLDCIKEATPYPIKGLHSIDGMKDDLVRYFNEGMCAGVPTGFENLDKLYTIMPGEVTVVTGIPNSGKSEFMDALMINLAKNEAWKFAVFSPEGVKEQHIALLVEKVVGAPSSPSAPHRMSLDQFMNGAAWVAKFFYFIRADDEDSLPTVEYVLEKASSAVYRYGIKVLLIDPWNELEHSKPANMNDTDYVGMVLAKVCRWAKNRYVHVFIVAHPTKISADKDGKLRVPGMYDILGSSNWANKMDNGIAIHRSEDASDTTEVHVKKVRSKFVGRRGSCTLKYDRQTGRYSVPPNYEKFDNVRSDEPDMMAYEVG